VEGKKSEIFSLPLPKTVRDDLLPGARLEADAVLAELCTIS